MVAEWKDNERSLTGPTTSVSSLAETAVYRRIVLIIDDSKPSRLAIPRAAEMASHYHAELIIIRIFKPVDQRGVLAIKDPAIVKQAHLDAENDAKSICYKLIKQGIAARSYAIAGTDISAACRHLQSEEADLVVVVQPVVTRWSRMLFGNPVQTFHRCADVSVLFVGRSQ